MLLRQLGEHQPINDREAESVRRVRTELGQLPQPFDENADPVHVTASAVVIGPRGVLLHLHKRLGIWIQPGGHVDPGEELLAAAVRETAEETGLSAAPYYDRPVHIDVHAAAHGHEHLDVRFLLRADADPQPPVGESQDVAWFDWPDAVEAGDAALAPLLVELQSSRVMQTLLGLDR